MICSLQSCPLTEVVQVCKEHGINKPLEVTGLIPFNLSVGTVVDEDIRHVIPDKALDLFKDIWDKALLVFRWKRLQLFFV